MPSTIQATHFSTSFLLNVQYEDRKVTIDFGIQSLDSLEAIKMVASSCAQHH